MDTRAPKSEKDVAYQGPGNFARGCSVCIYNTLVIKAAAIKVSTGMLTRRRPSSSSINGIVDGNASEMDLDGITKPEQFGAGTWSHVIDLDCVDTPHSSRVSF